jgi:hypothetical protein
MSDDRDARLEAYLAGALDADARAAFEAEILADPELADALYAAESLNAALRESLAAEAGPAAVVRPPTATWRRRLWLAALPVAAVLAFMLLVPRATDPEGPVPAPVLRGDEAASVGLEPAGELTAAPERFLWTATAGAARYRLELYDGAGRPLLVRVLADTVLALGAAPADLVTFAPGDEPYWRVIPIDAAGRELASSPPLRFRLP